MNTLMLLVALVAQDPTFPDADPTPSVAAAKKRAAQENRRVLVLAGDNDSEPSRAAAAMLKKDKEVARLILYEYDVVLVGFKKLTMQVPASPCPYLILMDAEGKELSKGAAPSDPKAMLELLKKHKAEPWKAKDVLDAAMKKAEKEKKRVLLTFGAPWCGWCKRFEAWMAREDAATLTKEFVTVKIDTERMTGGQEMIDSYPRAKDQGIPWFVFLQPDGKELADSIGPKGNIGCPNTEEEIDAFLAIVKKASAILSADDIAALRKSLMDFRTKK